MGGEEVEIREAATADLEAIFAIYNEEVERGVSTFDTEPLRRGHDEDWLDDRSPRHPVLIAAAASEVVGWGSLSQWSPKRGYDRTAEVSVYVDRGSRGRGIGARLLEALIDRAPAGGIAVLLARIAGENPASIALHRSLGFEPIGIQRRAGEKFGRILDVALMDLHLDHPKT
jgi:phosphinothricin acetyltransferase